MESIGLDRPVALASLCKVRNHETNQLDDDEPVDRGYRRVCAAGNNGLGSQWYGQPARASPASECRPTRSDPGPGIATERRPKDQDQEHPRRSTHPNTEAQG